MYSLPMDTIGRSLGYAGFVLVAMLVFIVPRAQAQTQPDRDKFHAEGPMFCSTVTTPWPPFPHTTPEI